MADRAAQVFGAIREIFQVFDTNRDKRLDAAELRHAFACMVRAWRHVHIWRGTHLGDRESWS